MKLYKGQIISKKIGMGRVFRAPFASSEGDKSSKTSEFSADLEKERFGNALILAEGELKELCEKEPGSEAADIFEAQILLLKDEAAVSEIKSKIAGGSSAIEALNKVSDRYMSSFKECKDECYKSKALDIEDVRNLILKHLQDDELTKVVLPNEPFILVSDYITPYSLTKYLCPELKGIVVASGSGLSHTAVIARAKEIPMIRVQNCDFAECDGEQAIVDGNEGHFFIDPDMDLTAFYRRRMANRNIPRKKAEKESGGKLKYVNIESLDDARRAKENGATGIGLFRTEFLYMGRKTPPTEEESLEIYRNIGELFPEGTVTVRTFDLGGDKRADFLSDKEELKDLRGIKLAIREQDMLITQLKALMRANIYGNIKVMIPMVYGKTDILNVKSLIKTAKRTLEAEGRLYRDISLGIMVETESAVNAIEELSGLSKFFSIGTNDLRAEIAGEDRAGEGSMDSDETEGFSEDEVNARLSAAVKTVIAAAKEAGIECGICGETGGLDRDALQADYISS
ncbi:MAG: hypothetical protein K6E19_10435 [Lachnospiraceae bacterium]|nr:hypothetical protein [Lachnospiraceae bacterium]